MDNTTPTLPLGTISHGTYHMDDVSRALLNALDIVRGDLGMVPTPPHYQSLRKLVSPYLYEDYGDGPVVYASADWYGVTGREDVSPENLPSYQDAWAYLLEDLTEWATVNVLPAYTWIGAHPGDGSDFGVWPHFDLLDGYDNPEGVARMEAGTLPDYILAITDHGNATLYRVELSEVWGIV